MTGSSATTAGTERTSPRSALYELSVSNAKELVRDRKGSFSILFMFFFLLLLVVGINFAVNDGNRPAPVVTLSGDTAAVQRVADQLGAAGISVVPSSADQDDANASIDVEADQAAILLSVEDQPRWVELVSAVESSGIDYASISVVDESGFVPVDLLRANLPAMAAIGFMAITFMGTAVPLVALRQRGTLRLLGTTPVRQLTFIVAQTPVRFALGLIVAIIVCGIAVGSGYLDVAGLLRLAATFVIGLAMFFSGAYLLASRSRNPEAITNIAVLIPIVALFASGELFPRQILPEPVLVALNALPTTWFTQAAGVDLAGAPAFVSVYVLWGMMLVVTVGLGLLAARVFVWDDRER